MKSLLPSSSTPTRLFHGGEEGGKSEELGGGALAGCVIPTPSWEGPALRAVSLPLGLSFPSGMLGVGEDSSQLQSMMLLCSGVEESS